MQHSVTSGISSICAAPGVDAGGAHRTADRAAARHLQGTATAGDGAVSAGASVIECHVSTPRNTSKGTIWSVARFAVVRSASHTPASVNAKTKKRKDTPAAGTAGSGNEGG